MARNLQAKLPPSDSIRIFDINTSSAEKLAQEMRTQQAGGAAVQIASNAADAAREAVRNANQLVKTPVLAEAHYTAPRRPLLLLFPVFSCRR